MQAGWGGAQDPSQPPVRVQAAHGRPSAPWSSIIPHAHPPRVLSADEHMSSGKLSEQLAASPAICCCFSSGEEQVNALAGSQSPLPQCAYSYPSLSHSCANPSVPQSFALWGRDNRAQLLQLWGEEPLVEEPFGSVGH